MKARGRKGVEEGLQKVQSGWHFGLGDTAKSILSKTFDASGAKRDRTHFVQDDHRKG